MGIQCFRLGPDLLPTLALLQNLGFKKLDVDFMFDPDTNGLDPECIPVPLRQKVSVSATELRTIKTGY
jgi:hypothetical protein